MNGTARIAYLQTESVKPGDTHGHRLVEFMSIYDGKLWVSAPEGKVVDDYLLVEIVNYNEDGDGAPVRLPSKSTLGLDEIWVPEWHLHNTYGILQKLRPAKPPKSGK